MNSRKSIQAPLTILKTGKRWKRSSEPDGMSLDGKHITIKKPKKSKSEYYNYKGFFSLVLLALFGAEYRFLWVNVWSSRFSTDAQIFNSSNLLGHDAFCFDAMACESLQQKQLTREDRTANYRISRGRRVVENVFGILAI